jgi:hypothetical protein
MWINAFGLPGVLRANLLVVILGEQERRLTAALVIAPAG